MRMPQFTAEAGLGRTAEYYGPVARAHAGDAGQLRPALVAPPPDDGDGAPVCRTSGCFAVGGCKTRVRCCRTFSGLCRCAPVPCRVIFPA